MLCGRQNVRAHLEMPFYIIGHQYIIYTEFSAKPGLRIECLDNYAGHTYHPVLTIGRNVSFNYRCHIGVIAEVSIGDNVLIGSNVLITDHFHGKSSIDDIHIFPIERELYSKGPVIIENNVWIGDNVCIFPGVTIGENSIVGANTVVTRDVPPYSVVARNPLKVIRTIKQ